MSTALYECFLIKKIDIYNYLIENKELIQKRLIESDQDIVNLMEIDSLLLLCSEEKINVSNISQSILRNTLGMEIYLRFATNEELSVDKRKELELYLSKTYNVFNVNINIKILNLDIDEYLIVQDPHMILKDLHLADMSFHTGTDAWVEPFVEAIKTYNLISYKDAEDDYEIASRLATMMEDCTFEKPRTIIELYSNNRMWNFIDKPIILAMISNSINRVYDFYKSNESLQKKKP